jgi:hypothetical protein
VIGAGASMPCDRPQHRRGAAIVTAFHLTPRICGATGQAGRFSRDADARNSDKQVQAGPAGDDDPRAAIHIESKKGSHMAATYEAPQVSEEARLTQITGGSVPSNSN